MKSTSCSAMVTRFPRRVDLDCRRQTFDTIDGIFLLDDLIGFLRDDDFRQFALPYLKQVYDSLEREAVKFLHNDASGHGHRRSTWRRWA